MAPPQWAYQVENFVNEPDEELVCSICCSVFCDPVICPCDHVFCRACITKWLENNRNCPICRKQVSHRSVKQMVPIVKNIIMKLILNCHNKTLGCTEQFSLESSEAHMKDCEYELVQCKNKPCKDRLFRKDITEHETSDCPHRYIKCKTCGSKMPTPAVPEKHDCIRALQLRLRRKNNMIRKKNNRIKELRSENKALKATSQDSESPLSSTSRNFARPLTISSLSPEEIMINIAEFESTSSSLTSDSDDSSENSIIIFTNSPVDHSDNAESDSFLTFMDNQDSVEYSRNESPSPLGFSEYRRGESQTTDDLPLNDHQSDSHLSRNGNSAFETGGVSAEAPISVSGETEGRSQPRRQVKRRPTTQKPAKRRLPPLSSSSSDIGESTQHSSRQLSKRCWNLCSEPDTGSVESSHEDNHNSYMDAGPSSVVAPVAGSSFTVSAMSSNTKGQFCCKSKLDQKRAKHTKSAGENVEGSEATVPSGNAVFERTLALLEQYNLESDPEWLPEYASHRGDTSSDSDSSVEAEFVTESSSSELSDSDSSGEDNSNGNRDADVFDYVKWMIENVSDSDDPDWHPPMKYLVNRYA